MSEETKVATETASEETTPQTPTETPDVGSLIAESKKYRQRSQDAEAKLAKLESKLAEQEKAKLVEKEEWKALYESEKGYKDKYQTLLDQRKSQLLEKIDPDQREKFQDKDLDVIEFMVNNLSTGVSKEAPARGQIKPPSINKPYNQMNEEERRAYYTQMANKKVRKI